MRYKEFRNEFPLNTVKIWSRTLQENAKWEPIGWSGEAREPFRHWASYPEFDGVLRNMWDAINQSIIQENIFIKPQRVIMNLYSHGDSSWLHKDSSNEADWTVIIFLNEYWNINWGGDFVLVEEDEILSAFAATPGKFVLFQSNILHACRPVSREAPYPRFGVAYQCINDTNTQAISQGKVSSIRTPL